MAWHTIPTMEWDVELLQIKNQICDFFHRYLCSLVINKSQHMTVAAYEKALHSFVLLLITIYATTRISNKSIVNLNELVVIWIQIANQIRTCLKTPIQQGIHDSSKAFLYQIYLTISLMKIQTFPISPFCPLSLE